MRSHPNRGFDRYFLCTGQFYGQVDAEILYGILSRLLHGSTLRDLGAHRANLFQMMNQILWYFQRTHKHQQRQPGHYSFTSLDQLQAVLEEKRFFIPSMAWQRISVGRRAQVPSPSLSNWRWGWPYCTSMARIVFYTKAEKSRRERSGLSEATCA